LFNALAVLLFVLNTARAALAGRARPQ